MYFLGIDGGGTKTKGVITDESGVIIAESSVGATNPNNVPRDRLEAAFKNLFSDLEKKSNMDIEHVQQVFAGLSGVSRPADKIKMQQFLATLMGKNGNVSVDNDAVPALYSGTLGESGIVQISGTGSITYGINEQDTHDRVGGWGYLIDEKGSGFSIGQDGLGAAFRSHDGLGGDTLLHESILDHFQVDSLPEVIHPVYHADNVKEGIATLGKLVFDAADKDDEMALSIINDHGEAIGLRIVCLIEKLFNGKSNRPIPVVLAGGVFKRLDLFEDVIEKTIASKERNAVLTMPELEPVAGAVVAALNKGHIAVDETSFIKNYSNSEKGVER